MTKFEDREEPGRRNLKHRLDSLMELKLKERLSKWVPQVWELETKIFEGKNFEENYSREGKDGRRKMRLSRLIPALTQP